MSDRNLVTYEEGRNPEGPYWRLKVDRSANGQPGLLFTIEFDSFDGTLPHREMTVVVNNAWEVLEPVLAWLDAAPGPSGPELIREALERAGAVSGAQIEGYA